MTDTKHTPTPLRTGYLGRDILDVNGKIYANTYDRDNAAHIVKCVNMHEDLVEALIDTLKECDRSRRPSYALQLRIREALKKAGAL